MFALLPFVSLPTDRTNGVSPIHVEGGLMGFFEVALSHMFALELNDGVLYLRDDLASTHHTEFLTTANLEAEWTENVVTYYEVVAQLGRTDPLGDIVFFGTGVQYLLNKNLQLDGGVNLGITPAAARIALILLSAYRRASKLSINLESRAPQGTLGKATRFSCSALFLSRAPALPHCGCANP